MFDLVAVNGLNLSRLNEQHIRTFVLNYCKHRQYSGVHLKQQQKRHLNRWLRFQIAVAPNLGAWKKPVFAWFETGIGTLLLNRNHIEGNCKKLHCVVCVVCVLQAVPFTSGVMHVYLMLSLIAHCSKRPMSGWHGLERVDMMTMSPEAWTHCTHKPTSGLGRPFPMLDTLTC